MSPTVHELLREYSLHLESSDLSPKTVNTYKTSLNQFRKFLDEHPDIPQEMGDIKPKHIESFFAYRKRNGIGKGTRQQNYIHINLFWKWARKRYKKHVKKNPFKKVDTIPYKLPIRVFPERDLLQKLVESFDSSTFTGLRNRFAFFILKETGIRADELLSLEETDFDLIERILTIRDGKGGKSRQVPFPETVTIELLAYLSERSKQPKSHCRQLIITRQGGMAYATLLETLTGQCRILDIDHITPHTFRHAFADYLKESGVPDEAVMEIMGWDTRTMLDHYAKSKRKSRAIKAYRKTMAEPSKEE